MNANQLLYICCVNANSFSSTKAADLIYSQQHYRGQLPHVICVVNNRFGEHYQAHTNAALNVLTRFNYTSYRANRENRDHGGAAIFVHNSIESALIEAKSGIYFEEVWIQVQDTIIACIYYTDDDQQEHIRMLRRAEYQLKLHQDSNMVICGRFDGAFEWNQVNEIEVNDLYLPRELENWQFRALPFLRVADEGRIARREHNTNIIFSKDQFNLFELYPPLYHATRDRIQQHFVASFSCQTSIPLTRITTEIPDALIDNFNQRRILYEGLLERDDPNPPNLVDVENVRTEFYRIVAPLLT